MILITGAAGKTGQFVIRSLLARKQPVRAFVRTQEQKVQLERMGGLEVVSGDMTRAEELPAAFAGIQKVLHICPNVHPDEVRIGSQMIEAAVQAGVGQFVFHSVMHPQLEAMPHHWKKLRVEALLIESGLPYTIVQPASYMQNLPLGVIRAEGVLRIPYSLRTRHSVVDLADIAEVYTRVLIEDGHMYASYELAGPEALDHCQIIETLSNAFSKPLELEEEPVADWRQRAEKAGLAAYAVDTLVRMFEHYDLHGFIGNPHVLQSLLQGRATTLSAFLKKTDRL